MIRITPATIDDAPLLAAIHEEAFDPYAWNTTMFAASLAGEHVWGLKLLEDYGVLGFILCQQSGDDCEILTLAVLPARQHRGYGQRLFEATLATAKVRQNRRIILEVAADNRAGRKFYQAAGFTQIGERPDYYPRPWGTASALLMALEMAEKIESS